MSLELILLCCKDVPTLHRVCNGGKYVQESEIKGNLPDEVVDEDLISIQSYFSKKLLDKKGTIMYNNLVLIIALLSSSKENRMEREQNGNVEPLRQSGTWLCVIHVLSGIIGKSKE